MCQDEMDQNNGSLRAHNKGRKVKERTKGSRIKNFNGGAEKERTVALGK